MVRDRRVGPGSRIEIIRSGEVIPNWISRFEVWPYLERFALEAQRDEIDAGRFPLTRRLVWLTMGGRPITALNVCCFPSKGPSQEQYAEMPLRGLLQPGPAAVRRARGDAAPRPRSSRPRGGARRAAP